MTSLRHLGIQWRIMLYVSVGLAIILASFALLSLRAMEQATQIVNQERLNIASRTAGIIDRDFLHAARDVQEAMADLEGSELGSVSRMTRRLYDHLFKVDPFPFFRVSGAWVLDREGALLAQSGRPAFDPAVDTKAIVAAALGTPEGGFAVLPAAEGAAGVPFVMLATSAHGTPFSEALTVVVHTVSINSTSPYTPAFYRQSTPGLLEPPPDSEAEEGDYHLEIVNPAGIAVLGVGRDEAPGGPSPHFSLIQNLMTAGKAAAVLHTPETGQAFTEHVMAVVPLAASGFYIVLEQPVDVALALPRQLRQNFVLLTGLGFAVTLLVAWITTKQVVKPALLLTTAARRMAQGDLETTVSVRAQDELGGLTESLETMRQQLWSAHRQLEDTNRTLEAQVKERTARLAEVLKQIISAQEEERHRMARELHDDTAQALGALSISLDRARDGMNGANSEVAGYISAAKAIAAGVLEETRRLILDLRPAALDDLGLAPAIRWYAESHLEPLGVAVALQVDQPAARLPNHVEVSLFRVVQEAVNNIAKHASARHASIHMEFGVSSVRIAVRDDGRGFDPANVLGTEAGGRSVGLLGMQERVRMLNGTMEIHSSEGSGAEIAIEIPTAEQQP